MVISFYIVLAAFSVIGVVDVFAVEKNKFKLSIFLGVVWLTLLALMVVSYLNSDRIYEVRDQSTSRSYSLEHLMRSGRDYLLAQNGTSIQFIYYDEDGDKLVLEDADPVNVEITYSEGQARVVINETISVYHDQWRFIKWPTVTVEKNECQFYIPRGSVWYTYETN